MSDHSIIIVIMWLNMLEALLDVNLALLNPNTNNAGLSLKRI
jgi:hypothetical protein